VARQEGRASLADPSKVHYANYEGRWIKTRGARFPFRAARRVIRSSCRPAVPIAGREFAAPLGRGDLYHPARQGRDAGVLRRRKGAHGKNAAGGPRECAILPGVSVVRSPAKRADYLNSLISPHLNRAATVEQSRRRHLQAQGRRHARQPAGQPGHEGFGGRAAPST